MPAPPAIESCKTCRFFLAGAGGRGTCRESPPELNPIARAGEQWQQPPRDETEWCGKFELKKLVQ